MQDGERTDNRGMGSAQHPIWPEFGKGRINFHRSPLLLRWSYKLSEDSAYIGILIHDSESFVMAVSATTRSFMVFFITKHHNILSDEFEAMCVVQHFRRARI